MTMCSMKGCENGCRCCKCNKNIGLLLIRIALGVVFINAGWMKVAHMANTIGFFSKLGFGAPLAYLVGYTELIGGILVVLGLWTWIASGLFAVIMGVVLMRVETEFPKNQLPLVLFLVSLGMAFVGPGKYSLSKLFKKSGCTCSSCPKDCKNCEVCKVDNK